MTQHYKKNLTNTIVLYLRTILLRITNFHQNIFPFFQIMLIEQYFYKDRYYKYTIIILSKINNTGNIATIKVNKYKLTK